MQVSNRYAITHALCEKLKEIDGTAEFNFDISGAVVPKLQMWDEISEFPTINVNIGPETRRYIGGGQKDRFLTLTVRCYVNQEDAQKALEGLIADIEYIVDKYGRLDYTDRKGIIQTTRDITIQSIETDEGALDPLGVGEVRLLVQF